MNQEKKDLFIWLDVQLKRIIAENPHTDIKQKLFIDFRNFIKRHSHEFKDMPSWRIDSLFNDFWENQSFELWGKE